MWLVTVQRSTRCNSGLIRPLVLVSIASLLISACGSPAGMPPGGPTCQLVNKSGDPCYTPEQYRVAYGIQALLDRGIDGRGETVTVVAPVAQPGQRATDIRQDLESFDRTFRLPAARIDVVTSLAGSASPWQATGEEVGDCEHVHAVAPAATLRVVLIPSSWGQSAANGTADMLATLRLAVTHTDVASISWSLGEHYFTKTEVAELHAILLGAAAHHVTVIGSSGDAGWFPTPRGWGGQVKEVSLPASDPLVLGVGGTILTANPKPGAYISETAWPDSGGGFSHLYVRPAYQDGVAGISEARGVPDVAGDAAGAGGMALVFTEDGRASLHSPPGTSNSAPLWGGLVALADQYAHRELGFINPAIYSIARSSSYHTAFHDITTDTAGTNGYPATPGWDPVTGWGTPNAQELIPLLASFAKPGTT
ncbi:MAG TPA: S53 family peptidase [Candidatus Dormibacteraeota bacterium]